jgi:hypothetical protein
MIDSLSELRDSLIDAQRRADPHNSDSPFYLLFERETDGRVVLGKNAGALSGVVLCATCKPSLERMGFWKGQTNFMSVVQNPEGLTWEQLIGFALHEHAHGLLTHGILLPSLTKLAGPEKVAAMLAEPLERIVVPAETESTRSDASLHLGLRFGRVCIHLAHRAKSFAPSLQPRDAWDSTRYQLPPVEKFVEALGDEPQRLEKLPLSEIVTRDPPPAYEAFCRESEIVK